jgi:outer membrane protein assembly factor BamB
LCVIVLLTASPAAAQQWPQFRGPGASGVAVDDPRLPDTWSATDNVAWSVVIPGRGWSSPVVWGDHVFVFSAVNTRQVETLNPVPTYLARSLGGTMSGAAITLATDEYRWMLYDIDVQTGRIRWERVIKAAVPTQAVHQKNSFASETPVTDGEHVYVYLGYAGLFAFDMTGRSIWARPMAAPKMRTGWGTAASPSSTTAASISSTTTKSGRSSPPSTPGPAPNCGVPNAQAKRRTGRRRSSGRPAAGPRS